MKQRTNLKTETFKQNIRRITCTSPHVIVTILYMFSRAVSW